MIHAPKTVETAAKRFYTALGLTGFDHGNHPAKSLCIGAFLLYSKEWPGFNVGQWDWPFTHLAEGGSFDGGEPWTILFRRAVDISRGQHSRGGATHRIRRCHGNRRAWCLVALRDDGTEIDSRGGYTTHDTIDGLLRFSGGLLPGPGDLVEIVYYEEA